MRSLLAVHVYSGLAGPLLALVHTGHKFDSPLGVALTATTMVLVLSGFTGRYLLSYITHEIADKESMLTGLRANFEKARSELSAMPGALSRPGGLSFFAAGLSSWRFAPAVASAVPAIRVLWLAEAIADVEFAIRTDALFKRWFARWLSAHIALTVVLYVLLGLHVWSGIYFGLRWLR
jgi:hypothetical protein